VRFANAWEQVCNLPNWVRFANPWGRFPTCQIGFVSQMRGSRAPTCQDWLRFANPGGSPTTRMGSFPQIRWAGPPPARLASFPQNPAAGPHLPDWVRFANKWGQISGLPDWLRFANPGQHPMYYSVTERSFRLA